MQTFSNQQLNHIATENYRTLLQFCVTLETEGYWEQAEQVLHMKSNHVLEVYVQSLLVCFSVYCKHFTELEREFISSFSEKNELSFTGETEYGKIAEAAERFQNHPPILFQLLSLRDLEHGSGMAGLFFDGILNIMLCLSYLNNRREAIATKYLGIYFLKRFAFVVAAIIFCVIAGLFIQMPSYWMAVAVIGSAALIITAFQRILTMYIKIRFLETFMWIFIFSIKYIALLLPVIWGLLYLIFN